MKFVNLKNFRMLTGLGKEFAEAVDASLIDMAGKSGDVVDQFADIWRQPSFNPAATTRLKRGMLWVSRSDQTGLFRYEYMPSEETTVWQLSCRVAGGQNSSHLITVPLALVLAPENYSDYYQLYCHMFIGDPKTRLRIPSPNQYIGVTKRGWQQRWTEHLRASKNGSHYKFHEALRNNLNSYSQHTVVGIFPDEASVMAAEEHYVAECSLYPKGLNMIPGGYAGMRFLHRIGAVKKGERVSPDEKHEFINRHFEQESRAGRPNPFSTANWLNDEYAEKVICGAPDRLKPGQIREARYLESAGLSPDKIATEVGAKNAAQIRRLLGGDTYSRIH